MTHKISAYIFDLNSIAIACPHQLAGVLFTSSVLSFQLQMVFFCMGVDTKSQYLSAVESQQPTAKDEKSMAELKDIPEITKSVRKMFESGQVRNHTLLLIVMIPSESAGRKTPLFAPLLIHKRRFCCCENAEGMRHRACDISYSIPIVPVFNRYKLRQTPSQLAPS